MSDLNFGKDWESRFGDVPPLGYLLRSRRPDQWTRFHALPESKRSAETRTERRIILDRAAEIAEFLFGSKKDVWLATCSLTYAGDRRAKRKRIVGVETPLPFVFSRDESCFFGDQVQVEVYADRTIWRPGHQDALLTKIADDRENALWFEPSSGRVFAPYDGGFDIVVENSNVVARAEEKYSAWMSDLDSKL